MVRINLIFYFIKSFGKLNLILTNKHKNGHSIYYKTIVFLKNLLTNNLLVDFPTNLLNPQSLSIFV